MGVYVGNVDDRGSGVVGHTASFVGLVMATGTLGQCATLLVSPQMDSKWGPSVETCINTLIS